MIRELTQKVRVLQGRRIACEHCGGAYTYLAGEQRKFSTTGTVLVDSDERMSQALAKRARKHLLEQDRRPRWGEGLCPHCRRYQRWMVRSSRVGPSLRWGIGLFLASWCFSPVAAGSIGGPAGTAVLLLVPAAAGALGVWIGFRRALPAGVARGREDPFSITDDDARGLLRHCRAIDGDPLLEWYLHVHEGFPGDELVLPIGFRDLTGEEFFPAEVGSARVLAEG